MKPLLIVFAMSFVFVDPPVDRVPADAVVPNVALFPPMLALSPVLGVPSVEVLAKVVEPPVAFIPLVQYVPPVTVTSPKDGVPPMPAVSISRLERPSQDADNRIEASRNDFA